MSFSSDSQVETPSETPEQPELELTPPVHHGEPEPEPVEPAEPIPEGDQHPPPP